MIASLRRQRYSTFCFSSTQLRALVGTRTPFGSDDADEVVASSRRVELLPAITYTRLVIRNGAVLCLARSCLPWAACHRRRPYKVVRLLASPTLLANEPSCAWQAIGPRPRSRSGGVAC